ncbi:MAG TPA: YciI family protein [Devosia sp.]|nr:YciI family protein [Devosia sp.]
MRFMIMVKEGETPRDRPPNSEEIARMGVYNEELIKAGVLLAGEGLLPSKLGTKVKFGKKDRKVTDGPFSETKELIGGFWIIEVKDKAECLAWVSKIPFENGEEVEIRQVAEASDFVHDEVSTPWLEKEQEFRDKQKPLGT